VPNVTLVNVKIMLSLPGRSDVQYSAIRPVFPLEPNLHTRVLPGLAKTCATEGDEGHPGAVLNLTPLRLPIHGIFKLHNYVSTSCLYTQPGGTGLMHFAIVDRFC
jgi:hypothetical protein